jgi:hypothetical protein
MPTANNTNKYTDTVIITRILSNLFFELGCFIFCPVKPLLFFYQANISIVQED